MPKQEQCHEEARRRFLVDPSKCYQRHIREVWEELEDRHSPCNEACKERCTHFPKSKRKVKRITREEASSLILKYEWLASDPRTKSPLGRGIEACYGLFLGEEIIGANCFGRMGGEVGNVCGLSYKDKTGYLMRGVCTHYAPMHAASFFTNMSCKLAHKDMGCSVFFAYSDTTAASEIGTIYQACGWYFLGEALGNNGHFNYISPDGTQIVTSYALNHDKERKFLRSIGWTPDVKDKEGKPLPMRVWLRAKGWIEVKDLPKKKWATFVGTNEEKKHMQDCCRYPLDLPYPKNRTKNLKEVK